jgi:hypothetical protein
MRRGRTSPRAQTLADELRDAIQGFRPATSTEQAIYAQELVAMNDLDAQRETRMLDVRHRMPPILWIALAGLSVNILLFACLVGMEDTRLHMLGVSMLAGGIALVFFAIVVLERPFGTEFRVGPQPFELVLRTIERTGVQ